MNYLYIRYLLHSRQTSVCINFQSTKQGRAGWVIEECCKKRSTNIFWGFLQQNWTKLSESLSFDVYNMHARAGKWVFRAPEFILKRGVQQTISIVNGQVDQNRSSEMSSDSSARSPWTGVSQFLPTTQKLLQVSSRFNRYYTNDN